MNTTNTQDPIRTALASLVAIQDETMSGTWGESVNGFKDLSKRWAAAWKQARAALQPAAAQPQDMREAFEAWGRTYKTPEQGWWFRQLDDGGYSAHEPDVAWAGFKAGAAWKASTQPRVWTPEEIEAANKRAAEYTDWYLSGGKIASTQASEPSANAIGYVRSDVVSKLAAMSPAGRSETWITKRPNDDYDTDTPLYTRPAAPELTERQLMRCIAEAGCIGTIKMSFESGPYDIDRPTLNATKLCRAIERAHGIPATTPTKTQGGE